MAILSMSPSPRVVPTHPVCRGAISPCVLGVGGESRRSAAEPVARHVAKIQTLFHDDFQLLNLLIQIVAICLIILSLAQEPATTVELDGIKFRALPDY